MTNAPGQETEGVATSMYVPGGHAHNSASHGQETVGEQIRRRRRASLRLEPLPDGRRDPWSRSQHLLDDHDGDEAVHGLRTNCFKVPRSLHVEVGARTAWIYGRDGRDIFTLLDEIGLDQRQWDAGRRVWMVPVQYADDVISFAEWRQRRVVTVVAVDR